MNIRGQFERIVRFLESAPWRQFWEDAAIEVTSFAILELNENAPDSLIWQTCQNRGVVLFTGNRNRKGRDSLEEAIRTFNRVDSLPVVTLSDPIRFLYDGVYAERAAIRLLEYLIDLDKHRGAGRLFIP
jgi:hypothetical protein